MGKVGPRYIVALIAIVSALSGPSQQWATNGNSIYNTNSGGVGIGTSTPATALDINGQVRITSTGSGTRFFGEKNPILVSTYSNLYTLSSSDDTLALQSWASKPLILNPSGNNVGIITANASSMLTVGASNMELRCPGGSKTHGILLQTANFRAYLWSNYVAGGYNNTYLFSNWYVNDAGTNVISNKGG